MLVGTRAGFDTSVEKVLEPATGPLTSRTHVVELLRQRVMAGFGMIFGPGFEAWEGRSVPPLEEGQLSWASA